MRIATVLLAAGRSSRLGGTPKQLLRYEGETLIRRMALMALALQTGPVVVVLGANQAQIEPEISDLPLQLVVNPNWATGMASSLQVGLAPLLSDTIDGFLILLTDQPHITIDLLQQLITLRRQTGKGIVACRYATTQQLGVPALFAPAYLSEFMHLSGDIGARKLIQQHLDDCAELLTSQPTLDLDTWQDVETWRGNR